LKGNNIFCCGGGILKLGDFGISKVLTPNARAARTMIGTPYYMSPEILKVMLLGAWMCGRAADTEPHTHVHVCLEIYIIQIYAEEFKCTSEKT
jgi:serine/threonine protein kinase